MTRTYTRERKVCFHLAKPAIIDIVGENMLFVEVIHLKPTFRAVIDDDRPLLDAYLDRGSFLSMSNFSDLFSEDFLPNSFYFFF